MKLLDGRVLRGRRWMCICLFLSGRETDSVEAGEEVVYL